MANKPLDDSGQPDIMLKAAAQADGEQQRGVCDCIASGNPDKPKQHGADPHAKNCNVYREPWPPSVIITPEPDPPDVPACLWCIFNPAVPEYDPYCSLDCATASAIDDERNR